MKLCGTIAGLFKTNTSPPKKDALKEDDSLVTFELHCQGCSLVTFFSKQFTELEP